MATHPSRYGPIAQLQRVTSKHPGAPRQDGERNPQSFFHHGRQVSQVLQKVDGWNLVRIFERGGQLAFQPRQHIRGGDQVITCPGESLGGGLPSGPDHHVHLVLESHQGLFAGRQGRTGRQLVQDGAFVGQDALPRVVLRQHPLRLSQQRVLILDEPVQAGYEPDEDPLRHEKHDPHRALKVSTQRVVSDLGRGHFTPSTTHLGEPHEICRTVFAEGVFGHDVKSVGGEHVVQIDNVSGGVEFFETSHHTSHDAGDSRFECPDRLSTKVRGERCPAGRVEFMAERESQPVTQKIQIVPSITIGDGVGTVVDFGKPGRVARVYLIGVDSDYGTYVDEIC